MAIAVVASGSSTFTASEVTVGSAIVTGKTAVVQLDLNSMAAGDVVEINCYLKTTSGGTARMYFNQIFADVQSGSPVYQSIPVAAAYSVEFKVIQPTGTGRAFEYLLMTID